MQSEETRLLNGDVYRLESPNTPLCFPWTAYKCVNLSPLMHSLKLKTYMARLRPYDLFTLRSSTFRLASPSSRPQSTTSHLRPPTPIGHICRHPTSSRFGRGPLARSVACPCSIGGPAPASRVLGWRSPALRDVVSGRWRGRVPSTAVVTLVLLLGRRQLLR